MAATRSKSSYDSQPQNSTTIKPPSLFTRGCSRPFPHECDCFHPTSPISFKIPPITILSFCISKHFLLSNLSLPTFKENSLTLYLHVIITLPTPCYMAKLIEKVACTPFPLSSFTAIWLWPSWYTESASAEIANGFLVANLLDMPYVLAVWTSFTLPSLSLNFSLLLTLPCSCSGSLIIYSCIANCLMPLSVQTAVTKML